MDEIFDDPIVAEGLPERARAIVSCPNAFSSSDRVAFTSA